MTSRVLGDFYASTRPGVCPCGDPLPPTRRNKPRKVCNGCAADYHAIYGAARRRVAAATRATQRAVDAFEESP